jgi:N,N'-diacetyllegionaminate synthase
MIIGSHDISERVLVVAEIGNNHEGDFRLACEMVRAAAGAGADAVKFQTFRAEHYVGISNPDRLAQLKSFELTPDEFGELANLAHDEGVLFLSTPFDLVSLDVLLPIADGLKIASGDNDFFALLQRAAASPLPLIVSSGVSDLDSLTRTVLALEAVRPPEDPRGFAILHAVSSYPTPREEAQLLAIPVLAERFSHPIGYSDHTLGFDAAVLSVALGARIIEKHFTLEDIESDFRDHVLSATPRELAELVERVRAAEAMLGERRKSIGTAESANAAAIRRSIAAAADLGAGHVLQLEDLTWVRPGTGMRPGEEGRLVGRALSHPVAFGDLLVPEDVV